MQYVDAIPEPYRDKGVSNAIPSGICTGLFVSVHLPKESNLTYRYNPDVLHPLHRQFVLDIVNIISSTVMT